LKAPSRKTGLLCLILFVIAMLGAFVPMGHLPYVGPGLTLVNRYYEWLLMSGYALLLLATFML
jgi:hypothetical protein